MSEHMSPENAHGNARRRHGVKFLPALGAVVLVGIALVASRAAVQPAEGIGQPAQAGGGEKGDNQVTAKAVAAANTFLNTLDAGQRAKVLLDYNSPKKPSWSNLPVTFVPRNGIPMGELTKPQRTAALAALASVLSKQGYQKIIDIVNADDQLVTKENKQKFGMEFMYLAIFGKPSMTEPWMLQFGGHHLGLNVTVVGKDFVLTPTHTGTQPDAYKRDGKTVRPLGPENDLAFKLVNLLDEKQKPKAVLGAKPKNLVLGPGQDGKTVAPEGIKGSALTDAQRGVLLELIAAWVNILPEHAATNRLVEIKLKLEDTYFVWYGPTTDGSAVYYRIQGPTVLIEYAPQGGTSHIHTIIRDPSNDYAKKLTKS
jgi:hypothetical protein